LRHGDFFKTPINKGCGLFGPVQNLRSSPTSHLEIEVCSNISDISYGGSLDNNKLHTIQPPSTL
jgi:hypothetical protein